ncbi:SDR family oxidoreductase [Streptomyces sp. NPDC086091]|uniref:SDR family oxidoreductase n=1 Tax=Streptomyces sp. NPDC086091 TaxID=3365751 RepID=UPI00381C6E78
MNIAGNTIFIPGATSGIGLALATRLQAAGNTVIIGGRRTELLARLKDEHGFDTVTIDTTDDDSVLAARDTILTAHPGLNVVITMAGIMIAEDVRTADFLKTAERTVKTNILGPLRLVSAFVEHLRTRPDATIITVSSGLAHLPLAIAPSYNGSKAFIHRFTETLRLQLADTTVKVVELTPPGVRTELTPGQSAWEHFMSVDDYADETIEILRTQPDVTEVLVEAVKGMRHAEIDGTYDQLVTVINAG